MDDMVNHPPHYTQGAMECIDAIEAALGPEGFRAYCRGTAIKYAWRAGLKDDAGQDLEKGAWYLNRGARVEVVDRIAPDRKMLLLDEIATLKQRLQDQERQWLEAQDSLRAEWLKVVDVLSEIVPVVEGETTLSMVERAKARIVAEEIRREKAESELEVIDAVLGNRQVFDSCRSRAEKVGLAIRCASRGESLGPV